ncbi:reverse transcriptase [Gossypium australe]|uniref:Reverse transcriptase n=1 Tax=Gossypium australe TaxID=47621 RepID=A0A5B6W9M2_9ROSI|nr:reverse transcriptase [Gossypium australe]
MATMMGKTIFDTNGLKLTIARPIMSTIPFENNPSLLTWLLTNMQFNDDSTMDPMTFLTRFEQICSTMSYAGVLEEAIKFLLIPFALRGHIQEWLEALTLGTITTWEGFVQWSLQRIILMYVWLKTNEELLQFKQISNNDYTWRKIRELELIKEVIGINEVNEDKEEDIEEQLSEYEDCTSDIEEILEDEFIDKLLEKHLEHICQLDWKRKYKEPLCQSHNLPAKMFPSVFKPPILELNPLPAHLKYGLDEGKKLVVDAQWHFNPSMNEVIMKELVKLLDAGIAYPIFDSEWPFVIICDASDHAVGAVLGQDKDKVFHPIHYASSFEPEIEKQALECKAILEMKGKAGEIDEH